MIVLDTAPGVSHILLEAGDVLRALNLDLLHRRLPICLSKILSFTGKANQVIVTIENTPKPQINACENSQDASLQY